MLRSREDLHDYQERAVQFIVDNPRCALWLTMGLGKTVSTLTALADLIDSFEAQRVLIVAPLRVALSTWPAELRAWSHVSHLSSVVLAGRSPEERAALALNDKADLHIINRELVPWLVETFARHKVAWPYDTIVLDEASSFKSPKARRFKALRKVLPRVSRMIELTGTPASNGLLDLWAQVFLLDGGERLGRTYSLYRDRHFAADYMGYNWTPRAGAEAEIHKRLGDICLTLSAEDYLDLPPLIENDVCVPLPREARRVYQQLERDFLTEIEGQDVAVFNAAALTNKLLQCANGAAYLDDTGAWGTVHDAKLDALEDLIEAANGAPVLVAYCYRSDAERIEARFPQAERLTKDPNQIDAWNAGKVPLLLAHPASAGHGLNLQEGGRHVIWFGLNWSLELYQQFNARLHRQGQRGPVVVHRIVADETVDQTVAAALRAKDTTQRALLAALKRDASRRSQAPAFA